MGSVFSQSNDDLSPPTSELMPVATCANGTDLEEALREISREISSEFSCARDTDYATTLGELFNLDLIIGIKTKVGSFSNPGVEPDWSSDIRRRIQESSYIQEQYVLTHCSLSSERSLQTHSHTLDSNSDSAGGVFQPDSVLDTGSLPQGLEKMPPPDKRSSLSRWADPAWEQNLTVETPDIRANKVNPSPQMLTTPAAHFRVKEYICFVQPEEASG